MAKRFKYYPVPQIIEDGVTGKRYYGNQAIADLLNDLQNELETYKSGNRLLKATLDEKMKGEKC